MEIKMDIAQNKKVASLSKDLEEAIKRYIEKDILSDPQIKVAKKAVEFLRLRLKTSGELSFERSGTYHIGNHSNNGAWCSCNAYADGKPCWHVAAANILKEMGR